MKCICGYEEHDEATQAEKRFICIKGSFSIITDPNGYSERINEVKLYACPKCSTVQMYQY